MTRPARVSIDLETPLTVAGETVTRLTLRRPVAGELRGLELGPLIRMDVGAALELLPQICQPNVTQRDLEQLDPADLAEVIGTLAGFFFRSSASSAAAPSSTPSSTS